MFGSYQKVVRMYSCLKRSRIEIMAEDVCLYIALHVKHVTGSSLLDKTRKASETSFSIL